MRNIIEIPVFRRNERSNLYIAIARLASLNLTVCAWLLYKATTNIRPSIAGAINHDCICKDLARIMLRTIDCCNTSYAGHTICHASIACACTSYRNGAHVARDKACTANTFERTSSCRRIEVIIASPVACAATANARNACRVTAKTIAKGVTTSLIAAIYSVSRGAIVNFATNYT